MSFFIDANVLIYGAVDSPYREACVRILRAVAQGSSVGRVSPAVLEEVWYVERSGRAGAIGGLAGRMYAIFTPLLPVTDDAFRRALRVRAPRLGPLDRLHVGTCLTHGIDTIVSADAGFDAVSDLRRVDPLDADAVAHVLGNGRPAEPGGPT